MHSIGNSNDIYRLLVIDYWKISLTRHACALVQQMICMIFRIEAMVDGWEGGITRFGIISRPVVIKMAG